MAYPVRVEVPNPARKPAIASSSCREVGSSNVDSSVVMDMACSLVTPAHQGRAPSPAQAGDTEHNSRADPTCLSADDGEHFRANVLLDDALDRQAGPRALPAELRSGNNADKSNWSVSR